MRSALFDSLMSQIDFEDYLFIDLFAGSGTVGIEALSRGFNHAFFVEQAKSVYASLIPNLKHLDSSQYNLFKTNAYYFLSHQLVKKTAENNCLIFIDPPYIDDNFKKTCAILNRLKPNNNCLIALQSAKNQKYYLNPNWIFVKTKSYSNNRINYYKFEKCTN